MLHKDEIKILRIVNVAPILVVIFSAISIFWVYQQSQIQFKRELEQLKTDSVLEMESLIKSEVLRVYDFIKAERMLSTDKIKANLQGRVQEAHAIAMSIYSNNQHRSRAEIKILIKDALRDIRFNKGRGYFFIYENNGTSVMHPISPQLENRNLWNFQDVKGRYVIQELSEIAQMQGEGVLTWWWKKPSDIHTEYEKIGYSKSFAPFDWFIGTGDYVADYEEELKKELLLTINKVRFGKEGYVFVIDSDGTYLSHVKESFINQNRIDYQDENGVAITKEVLALARSGEGFLSYIASVQPSTGVASAKRSFVKGFEDWQWAIGSGAYLNDIDNLVSRKATQLNEINHQKLIQSILFSSLISAFLFCITLFFSKSIERRFLKYHKNVSQKNIALHDLNANLEKLVFTRTEDLEQSNKDLESTLLYLKSTQSKLVESEKMASMAGLVSGIAHELNTPLGIMVTSISQVEKEINWFFDKLSFQKLTRKDLLRVQETWGLGYKLLNTSLQRSVELVHNFKSLSTHNDSQELQIFSMRALLDSVTRIYVNQFKQSGVQYTEHIDSELILTSYENILADVFVQLIKNSLTHGFEQVEVPCINISIFRDAEMIEISYIDNGMGSSDVDKIFEPFYTTKRGKNCTGLGLPIIYNQVVHKLQGTIVCSQSALGGLSFQINIPISLAK